VNTVQVEKEGTAYETRDQSRSERDDRGRTSENTLVIPLSRGRSPVRGRPFAPGNSAARARQPRATNVIEQLDRTAAKTVQRLMAVDPKMPLDPPRANAIIFALRFRSELYGQY